MAFSWRERQKAFEGLPAFSPELLILGGGVVGCSIASHSARLGLRTVLIERDDLASGASGQSTGLAHAGLRYLAQGRVGYVFHEGRERQRLAELAPHWIQPFDFILPVYSTDPYPLWQVKIGTWIYDALGWMDAWLTRRPIKRRHRTLSPAEIRDRLPGLRLEGLVGGVEYFVDAKVIDSRFTLGWAQQAAQRGARILTYSEAEGIRKETSGPQQVVCKDRLSGKGARVAAPLVINATGAWIDSVRFEAGWDDQVTSPSKGIHLVVDQIAAYPLIFSAEPKGRVFFVLPYGRETSVIGTTETPLRTGADDAGADESEIDELIRRLFAFFPYLKQGSNLQESINLYRKVHVRDVFWGIRPLLKQGGDLSQASREHRLLQESPSFWSIPGVKLTAARAAVEEVARAAWKALRKEACPRLPPQALPGGEIRDYARYVLEAQRRFRIGVRSDDILAYLVNMYGTRYLEVLALADAEPHYRERVIPEEPWIPAEAAYACHQEMVLTLNDFLWRRSKWAHQRDFSEAALHLILSAMADPMEWTPEDIDAQLNRYYEERRRHRPGA